MNLDYEKIKQKMADSGSHWASYSDLFMALSFLFLLLYVVASFRTGTVSHTASAKQAELLGRQNELESQIKIYERISQNYLEQEANKEEKNLYESVLNQLSLLDSTSQEKERELQASLEAEKQKQIELNKYQETVKNLVNANMNSSKDVRDREQRLAKRVQELNQLEFALKKKQQELNLTGTELKQTSDKLQQTAAREVDLRKEALDKKKQYEEKLAQLTEKAKKEIAVITEENRSKLDALALQNESQIRKIKSEFEVKKNDLLESTKQLELAQKTIATQAFENQILLEKAKNAASSSQLEISAAKERHLELLQNEQEEFHKKMEQMELNSQEKIAAEKEYRQKIEQENKNYNENLEALQKEIKNRDQIMTELKVQQDQLSEKTNDLVSKLDSAQAQTRLLQEKLKTEEQEAEAMRQALVSAKEKSDRRKNISDKLAKSFRDSGLDVLVNSETGDLILNFGNEYFDAGKYFLKTGMKETLNRVAPIYARALFEDVELAKHIDSVEIVGFASPTYKNRVMDPTSLKPEDRSAINYNLDLSYKRARAIFKYIFDVKNMKFSYQSRLLPLVKVTGRSFFTEEIEGGYTSNIDVKNYCLKFDCNSAQKVIVRFNLKD